ncbi:hypothetical protein ABVT39_010269 [Epinephelus coioides]
MDTPDVTPGPAPAVSAVRIGTQPSPPPPTAPGDLGTDEPAQVRQKTYPTRVFNKTQRSFNNSWFNGRDWLEYSVAADAAFCFPCRKFAIGSSAKADKAFTHSGFSNWKTATESSKGFSRHASSKEHLKCSALWKEYCARSATCTEVATLVNEGQLPRNRSYLSAIVDIIEFLVTHQQPLRGSLDALESREEGGSGLFLSMMEYTLRKDTALAQIFSTIPKNATYTSHEIQNEMIVLMSEIVTNEIVTEIGDSYYTLIVDGTKDPTGFENVSIVLRYLDMDNEMRERLLVMATAEHYDASSLTNLVLSELRTAGLSTDKILSQCYDGASVMSGKRGGVQKILQEKVNREVPYVHCFTHQLHLVIVHAMSAERALQAFFDVCDMLYRFLRKPTVAAAYTGECLKRLLDQRWTGHLAIVSVIVKSYDAIVQFLADIDSSGHHLMEMKIEAAGLLKAIKDMHFRFTAVMVHRILSLLDPPNKVLQDKKTDLYTGVKVVRSALECVEKLQSDLEFQAIWAQCATSPQDAPETASPPPSKRMRQVPTHLQQYVVESTVGQEQQEREHATECKRLFFRTLDSVTEEMNARFGERNSQLVQAMCALDPGNPHFLDAQRVRPLLELTNTTLVESEFTVARHFLQTEMARSTEAKWTPATILQRYSGPLTAMPSVLAALRHGVTFGSSSATCENSFSTLTNVFSQHRRSMLHPRKAHLIQLAFESDLTRRFREEDWKGRLLRKFNTKTRRLQLY